MPRLRPAVLLSLLAALALVVAACGGSDENGGGQEASADTDVNQLLTQTFSGTKKVESGNLNLKLQIEAQGGQADQLGGPVSVSLAGPFQSQGGGKLPKFRLEANVQGGGQNIKAGATSTGEKGFLSFQGTEYVVDDQVFQQFKTGYEEAQKQAKSGNQDQQSFATLGMDPRKWLTDPKNEGEAKVGDDDTIKITGGIDVAKLLDDDNTALAKANSLGLNSTGEVPEKLTEQQRQQVIAAVKDPRVEIYTGKDDSILRRLVVNLGIEDANSDTTGTVAFDVSISDLNEDQDIAEPAGAKPFSELLGQFGGLGLGAAGSGSGSGSGSTGGTDDGGAAAGGDIEKYSKCVTDAGNDLDKVRECSELLATP
jgi:hypothetical protein